MIRLQPAEVEARNCVDSLGQANRGVARRHAAAVHADFDLDQDADLAAETFRCGAEVRHVAGVIDAHRHPGVPRQGRQARQLAPADHLVADQHVAHAALDHDLRLADLLAAHADRAVGYLVEGDHRRLVGLGVGPEANRGAAQAIGHARQVALVGRQIDDQRRRIDLADRRADLGRAGLRHRVVPPNANYGKIKARPDPSGEAPSTP